MGHQDEEAAEIKRLIEEQRIMIEKQLAIIEHLKIKWAVALEYVRCMPKEKEN